MRRIALLALLLSCFACTSVLAQNNVSQLRGAWESTFEEADGRLAKLSMIISDGHLAMTSYYADNGEFVATLGGSWRADWDNFSITYEFDSANPGQVGSVATMPYELTDKFLIFNGNRFWTRVDDFSEGELAGAWQIVGRARDGDMEDLSDRIDGPRKTMKILSGTRFQWIAFDTKEKTFMGTGGGSYTTTPEGLYIEKIEFFSRDDSRVGQQLSFDFALQDGRWVHRGLSSKGAPIHEIWAKR